MLIKRMVRVALALGVSLALLVAGSVIATPAVSAGTADDEQVFAQLINQVRADVGLPPLVVHSELTSGARSWAQSMATSDQLAHSPNMASGVTAQWTVLGENVGVHGVHNLQQLFDAFVASPSHYKNLVDPRFQYVGIGVVHTDAGKLWTTHRFMAANTPPPTTAPPTTAPPTTAAPTTTPPTTAPPTTAPTTAAPTTAAPTTKPTTTAAPTTRPATTARPKTTTTTRAPAAAPSSSAPTASTPATSTPATSTPSTTAPDLEQPAEPLDQADMAELVKPDVATIEEVLIDLVEAGI